MESIKNISFKNKTVLIRVDFNVPLDASLNITDNSRIVAALPTIKKVLTDGGKSIIISHLGRPKNGFENCFSLKHIVQNLSELLNVKVKFCNHCIGEIVSLEANKMSSGDVLLLENLRFHIEEENGDKGFAKKLAKLADVYINDAFGAAHRAHSSTAIVPNYFKNKYFGFLFSDEIKHLNLLNYSPKRPFTAIIGGAKISGKIKVITSLLDKVDNLIVGGGMAYTFAKAMGGSVGKSLVEDKSLSLAKDLVKKAKKKGVSLLLPVDSINASSFNNNAKIKNSDINTIPNNYLGLDIGKKSISIFSNTIINSKTIVWNGPMGVFEMSNFEKGTKKIALAVSRATKNGAFSLVGGGDSIAALKKFNLTDDVSYISTGGGAMLKYIEGKVLPAILSLES